MPTHLPVRADPGLGGEPAEPEEAPPRRTGSVLLRRQILLYLPGAVGPAGIGILFTVVFTRLLDVAEYGRYSLALSGSALVASLGTQWLVQGVNRYLPGRRSSGARNRLKGSVAMAVAIVAAALGLLGSLAWLFGRAAWASSGWGALLIATTALTVMTATYNPLIALLQSEMRAGRHSLYQLGLASGRFLLAVLLVSLVAKSAASLIWAWALATALLLPLLWRNAGFPTVSWIVPRARRLVRGSVRMARYGIPMTGWVMAAALLEVGDRYVIQFIRGSAEVGIYSANYNLVVGAVGLVAAPVLLAAHPFLMRAWEAGEAAETGGWLGTIVEWFAVMGVILVGFVALFARDLAELLLGPAFREGYVVIPVVLGGVVVWQLAMYAHKPLEFVGRTRLLFGLAIAVALMNLLLNVLLVPRFGYHAAAYTTLISYMAYALLAGYIGQRVLPWSVRLVWLLVIGLIFGLGLVLAALVRPAVEAHLGWGAGLAASVVVAICSAALVLYRALPVLLARRPLGER